MKYNITKVVFFFFLLIAYVSEICLNESVFLTILLFNNDLGFWVCTLHPIIRLIKTTVTNIFYINVLS